MKKIVYETAWGKRLYGEECSLREFIGSLNNNKNANNINVDSELQIIEFINTEKTLCSFDFSKIKAIRQYIEEEIKFDIYYYQICLMDGDIKEFSINCCVGR